MQPCNRIYYSTIHWRLNMFWAAYRSSSGALTVFAASGLHTHVVTGRSQVWVGTHAYVNQRLQIQVELLMMSGMPLETCWAFSERWNNKFYYKVASCWLFLLNMFGVCFSCFKQPSRCGTRHLWPVWWQQDDWPRVAHFRNIGSI